MADGTSFQIDIQAKAAGVDSAASSLDTLAARLTSAGAASADASKALAAGEASYRQTEATADRAAKALEKIGLAADAQRKKLQAAMDGGDGAGAERAAAKLRALTDRQAETAAKADQAKAAVAAEASALDRLKSSAVAAAEAEGKASKALDAAKTAAAAKAKADAAAAGTGKVNEMAEAFGKLGGPAGLAGQKVFGFADALKKLGSSVGSAGPYVALAVAVAALAAGIAAAGAAALVAVGQITAWAVSLADAGRSQSLLAAGFVSSVAGGAELEATIQRLGGELPQTRDELTQMAADLAKTGLRGEALTKALEETATKAAEVKWGPDFGRQTLALSKQVDRFKSNISGVFGRLNIEGVLIGMSKLVELFDATSVTGNAMKVVFESLFQPILDGLTAIIPKAVATFIQLEILVLKAMIAIKPYGSKILLVAEAFGVLAAIVGGGLAIALGVVVVSLGLIAFAIGVVVSAVTALIAGAVWLAVKLGELQVAVGSALVGAFNAAAAWLGAIDLSKLGSQIMQGLINGITGAAGGVVTSISNAVNGGVLAAKQALGIASPSKVFAEIGAYTAEGMAVGVDRKAGDVQGSLEAMVSPPPVAAGSSTPAGGGQTFTITINAAGGDGKSIAEEVRRVLTDILEGDAAQLGGTYA